MLEDLRKEAEEASFIEDDASVSYDADQSGKGFLTPGQRFVIVFMLFTVLCLLGSFILLLTGKVVPPVLY